MTLEAMQHHEAVTLHYARSDYRRQGVLSLVKKHVSGSRVLDMRCLEGQLAVALAMEGREVFGLDGFIGAVEQTNLHAEQSGLKPDLAHLWDLVDLKSRVGEELFDCVLCLDLLNHVQSDRETLEEISGVLRPGGTLILLVPAFESLLGERDRSLGHLRRYSRSSIRSLLQETGYTTAQCRYWNALALPAYVVVENLPGLKVSDRVRYAGSDSKSAIAGPLLRLWYSTVEKRIPFPFGLSIFVIARKQ